MPWGGIFRVTAQITAIVGTVTFIGLTAVCVSALRQQADRDRSRWTDKNRWE